jgi:sugar lactone lactonase YvrE
VTHVLGKTGVFDFCGDLCTDASGRYWLADPGGFLKCYDAEAGELTRYKVNRCGRPASCRIRLEDGEEVIYVTELKRRGGPAALSKKCDGRGVVVIPLKELTKAGEDRSA